MTLKEIFYHLLWFYSISNLRILAQFIDSVVLWIYERLDERFQGGLIEDAIAN